MTRWRRRRIVLIPVAVVVGLYVAAMAYRVYVRQYYLFLPDYVRWTISPPPTVDGPTHVFVLLADHFEPLYDARKVQQWGARYRRMAANHADSRGRRPQHTWFYPGEQYAPEVLEELRHLAADGLGEVELHFHHGWDTSRTLQQYLEVTVRRFQQFGFLRTVTGETRFSFVHGNWGLDNSNGIRMCGVNTELRTLRELGAYADFTFPSIWEASQPPAVNAIYAVKDDERPKSYARQWPLATITDGSADLMLFMGPLVFSPSLNLRRLFLDLDDGNVHASVPASPARADRWIRANVHVPERPDWIFVKLFAHGISTPGDEEATTGDSFSETLSYLESRYNDGDRYVLHYITAREAYNLARAASEGARGAPDRYMDAYIAPYVASSPRVPTVLSAQR